MKKKNIKNIYLSLQDEQYFIKVDPVIDLSMRKLCTRPYPLHLRGCPNFNKKAGCPPKCLTFDERFLMDIKMPFYAIYNKFDFRGHCDRMRAKHSDWTQRQIECCLYWQGTARKSLREKTEAFLWKHPHYTASYCPEGEGVNLTKTMKNAGIILEWPPVNYTYQIVLAGIAKCSTKKVIK